MNKATLFLCLSFLQIDSAKYKKTHILKPHSKPAKEVGATQPVKRDLTHLKNLVLKDQGNRENLRDKNFSVEKGEDETTPSLELSSQGSFMGQDPII